MKKNLTDIEAIVKKAVDKGKYALVPDKRKTIYSADAIAITDRVMSMRNASYKATGK